MSGGNRPRQLLSAWIFVGTNLIVLASRVRIHLTPTNHASLLLHFVAQLFGDFSRQAIIGEIAEGRFLIGEAALSLNRLHQIVHARACRHGVRAQGF